MRAVYPICFGLGLQETQAVQLRPSRTRRSEESKSRHPLAQLEFFKKQAQSVLFRLLRNANLQFLKQITPEQWDCFGIHAERGRITIRDLVVHMAGHDANHIEQIRTILR